MSYRLIAVEKNTFGAIVLAVPTFGENLRRLRLEAGFRFGKDLAEALGIKPSVVSRWESGDTGLPEGPTLLRLAKILNRSIDDLLAGVDADYDVMRGRAAGIVSSVDREVDPALADIVAQATAIATSADSLRSTVPEILVGLPEVEVFLSDVHHAGASLRDAIRFASSIRGEDVNDPVVDQLKAFVQGSQVFIDSTTKAIASMAALETANLERSRLESEFDEIARRHGHDPSKLRRQLRKTRSRTSFSKGRRR